MLNMFEMIKEFPFMMQIAMINFFVVCFLQFITPFIIAPLLKRRLKSFNIKVKSKIFFGSRSSDIFKESKELNKELNDNSVRKYILINKVFSTYAVGSFLFVVITGIISTLP